MIVTLKISKLLNFLEKIKKNIYFKFKLIIKTLKRPIKK